MEKIARRSFCETALVALPLLCIQAGAADDLAEQSDLIVDNLADELTRIAADGAQNGFKSEHLRRCAGLIRTFDVRLEEKGVNKDLDRRLEQDDFKKLNPLLAARKAVEYWDKHGIHLYESELTNQLTMDPNAYREIKQKIKKGGGIRKLHAAIAESLEQRAAESADLALKGAAAVLNGRIAFRLSGKSNRLGFRSVQLDIPMDIMLWQMNIDCVCKAMLVEASMLGIACTVGCAPCCPYAAFILASEKLLEAFGLCQPSRCS